MNLTQAQKTTLKNFINSTPAILALFNAGDYLGAAAALNANAAPDFWVWRTNVSRAEIYHQTSVDATTWSWTIYKNQSATEQNAWVQMFMNDAANFALPNFRAGIAVIFAGAAAAQNTHCLAIGRRLASIVEKLLATGTGSTASPATMLSEGPITGDDVYNAMAVG